MDSPVTERMCKERHDNFDSKLEEVKDEITKIRILWSGNGDIGYKDKISRMWEEHLRRQKTSQGLWDWGFRLLVILILGWLGLK